MTHKHKWEEIEIKGVKIKTCTCGVFMDKDGKIVRTIIIKEDK